MKTICTDILVIGAGPAGSTAAKQAALQGAQVLVVEQRSTIGVPVQCAEFIPAMLIGDLSDPKCDPRSFVVQKIKGMQTYINGRLENKMRAPGLMIRRAQFDQFLAGSAEQAGAKIFTGTKAIRLNHDGSVLIKSGKGEGFQIRAKVIIAADGPLSRVRSWINAPVMNPIPGLQMSFALTKPLEYTQVYFDASIRAGYAWLFPKGKTANVGLGFRKIPGYPSRPYELLKAFVEKLKKDRKISGEFLSRHAGWIPAEPLRKAVYKNVMFVGDAAGQTHPITGAGIFPAVTCGSMAGEIAAWAIARKDLLLLNKYDRQWQEMFARTQTHAMKRRRLMESRWEDFNNIIKSCWIAFGEYHGV